MHDRETLREGKIASESVESGFVVKEDFCDAMHNGRDCCMVAFARLVNEREIKGARRYDWG